MKSNTLLFLIACTLFTCNEKGNSNLLEIPSPVVSPAIVATGLLNNEAWEASSEHSPNIVNDRINISLKDQGNTNCPWMSVSFVHLPMAVGSYTLKNYPAENPPAENVITTNIFLACGDAISGSYRIDDAANASFLIEPINEDLIKGTFSGTYLVEFDSDTINPEILEFADIQFEIPRR